MIRLSTHRRAAAPSCGHAALAATGLALIALVFVLGITLGIGGAS